METSAVLELHGQDTPVDREERAAQQPPRIKRIQSLPSNITTLEFWSSLPMSTRLFLLLSILDVILVVAYASWQFPDVCLNSRCSGELLHILLAMLVAAVFFVMLVWDAILTENDFELLATMILSVFVSARVLFHLFREGEGLRVLFIVITIVCQVLTICMAYLTYRKFGWRIYSKLACDLRLKDAQEKKRLYFMLHRFQTLVKLDIQFLVLMVVVGVVMSLEENKDDIERNSFWNLGILVSTVLGSILSLGWVLLAYYGVKSEKLKLFVWLERTLPVNFVFPILAVVFVYVDAKRDARVAKESLLVAVIFFLVTRFAVWWYMRALIKAASTKSMESMWDLHLHKPANINPDLLPLLQGAWVLKPSFESPNKKRFFQLSQDFTTLRWAWNNYVLLYYVDELRENDDNLSITLNFSMEPDLILKFKTNTEFQAWRRGLTLVITMMLAPDPAYDRCNVEDKLTRKSNRKHGYYADEPTSALQKLLKSLGIAVTNRRHGIEEPMYKEPSHRHAVAAVQHRMSMSQGTDASGGHDALHNSWTHQDTVSIPKPDNLKIVMNLDPKEVKQRIREDHTRTAATDNCSGESWMQLVPQEGFGDSMKPARPMSIAENPAPLTVGDSTVPVGGEMGKSSPQDYSSTPLQTGVRPPLEFVEGLGLQMQVETIDFEDIEFGKFLGAGAEGSVWAAWYLETPVAVKKTDSMNEVEMYLSAGQHDNIVGLRGLCKRGSETYIVLEYCPRGTLDVLVHQTMSTRWDLGKVLQLMKGVARGMFHLHTRRPAILHRDLKPGNIFIGRGLVMKVGDFGMSRFVTPVDTESPSASPSRLVRQLTPDVIGTPVYAAPEIMDERLQNKDFRADRVLKADVYSYGVTLWEVMTRERAHAGLEMYEIVGRWVTAPEEMKLPPVTVSKDEPPHNHNTIRSLSELVAQCTAIDPDNRPDFKTILKRMNQLHKELGKATDMITSQDNR